MIKSKGSPLASNLSAQSRTLLRLARSSSINSRFPLLPAASFCTCAVAAFALVKSRAAPVTCAPCAASDRAVSTPSPAETPVTRIRLPRRSTPDNTSSVVEIASSVFIFFYLPVLIMLDVTVHGVGRLSSLLLHSSGLRITHVLEISEESWPRRVPSQLLPCTGAGGREMPSNECCEPAKMSGGLFRCNGDRGHVQTSREYLGDVSSGHSLFCDCMKCSISVGLLQHQPVQVGSIEAMSRRPAVEPIANVCRNTLFPGEMDRICNKALLNRVMDLGEPHDSHADALSCQRSGRLFRGCTRSHFRTGRRIVFGTESAW